MISSLLTAFLLVSVATAVFVVWRGLINPGPTRTWEAALAAACVLAFGALDWALLAALPRLGLSFGPLAPALAGLIVLRIFLFILAVIPLLISKAFKRAGGSETALSRRLNPSLTTFWVLNLIILVCELDGLYFEPFNLQTTTLSLPAPSFLPGRPLRILQLADIHVERTTRRERELIDIIHALQPDLILMTGDYLNIDYVGDPIARQDARSLMAQLSAPYGVYGSTGSVDQPDDLRAVFDGLNITLLHDEVRRLSLPGGDLYLIGVDDQRLSRDRASLQQLMSQVPLEAYSLLLYHSPDLVETAAQERVRLYLAGHTHGGQIRLPLWGALVTFSAMGKKYEAGQYILGQTTLYVSRGIGMEGLKLPRVRFLCPPEVVVINLGTGAVP